MNAVLRARFWLPMLALSTLLNACSHYQMGRPGVDATSAPVRVWIAPVIMDAVVADVMVPLQRELREQVIRNPSMQLVNSPGLADARLHVIVDQLLRETLARRSDDTGLADVMRLELVLRYELEDAEGQVTREGVVDAGGPIFREAGFAESARQRLPAILNELARDILQEAFFDW
ncbi:MAG: hypothetical protein ABQ298_14285 [Puniceicoccaceae bacterium]